MSALEQRLRGATVRIVDTETTGLTGEDGLVEVAIVQVDELMAEGAAGEPRLVLHTLVDPLVPSPWAGTPLHGLTIRDVVGAPTWPEVRDRVWSLLSDPLVVLCAHNASFDRRFLHEDEHPLPESTSWLDTMKIGKRLDPEPSRAKLEALCEAHGIRLDGHRATTDAIATGWLLPKLIRKAYGLPAEERPPERPTLGEWVAWQSHGQRQTASGAARGQESLFGERAEAERVARRARGPRSGPALTWVVRGGVGGSMYCASAAGNWPFRWVHRVSEARRFAELANAADVALLVEGRVERAT